ncbi:hypothetical protein SD074_04490 [Prolixibacter sp. SD074]|nr:hypothetical protein SD074_04490 [Prolixibacter sp. SD074]
MLMIPGGKKIQNAGGFEIFLIADYQDQDIRNFALADALVLDWQQPDHTTALLKKIRSSFIESIYLLPVFIFNADGIVGDTERALSDGELSVVQEEPIVKVIRQVKKRREDFTPHETNSSENRILTKLFRYMYTRDKALSPEVDVMAHMGYEYPLIRLHYPAGESMEMLKILRRGTDNDFFQGTFVDKTHICPSCHSGHLNLREVCTQCASAHISSENLIHHFVCAYMGPEGDFMTKQGLVCPKCNRQLRHIGVDYDKPSVIYRCHDCRHEFQEPDITALCLNCKTLTPVENLKEIVLDKYVLTDLGRDAARTGIKVEGEEREFTIPGFVNFGTFLTFLRFEIERIKVSGKESQMGSVSLNLPARLRSNRQQFERVVLDISDFIRNNTDSSDILSFASDNTFFMIFPEKGDTAVATMLNDFRNSIEKLLVNTFENEPEWNLTAQFETLNADTEYTALINQVKTI